MNLGEIRKIKAVMDLYGVRPNPDLGQNFLIDRKYLDQIIESAQPLTGQTVLEIGPGLGILTQKLCREAKEVLAVEIDPKLIEILRTVCIKHNNLVVKNIDIRQLNIERLGRYKVVANIPYYLTSNIIRKFLESENKPSEMILLVQKEVAQRICAMPSRMSLLSVSVQFYCNPKLVGVVPRDAFYPAPQVDSAIIKLNIYKTPIFSDVDSVKFFRLVRAGFNEKRKQLANAISGALGEDKNQIALMLRSVNINPERRAETLSLAEWRAFYKIYYGQN